MISSSKFLDAATHPHRSPEPLAEARIAAAIPAIPRHPPPPPPRRGPDRRHPAPLPAWQGDTNVGDAHGGGGLRRNPQAPTQKLLGRYAQVGASGGAAAAREDTAAREAGAPARRARSRVEGRERREQQREPFVTQLQTLNWNRAEGGSERKRRRGLPKTSGHQDFPRRRRAGRHERGGAPAESSADRGGGAAGPAAAKRPVTHVYATTPREAAAEARDTPRISR